MWARYTLTISGRPALKVPAPALKVSGITAWWGGVLGKQRCFTLGKQNLRWSSDTGRRRGAWGSGWQVEGGDRNFFTGMLKRTPVTQILQTGQNLNILFPWSTFYAVLLPCSPRGNLKMFRLRRNTVESYLCRDVTGAGSVCSSNAAKKNGFLSDLASPEGLLWPTSGGLSRMLLQFLSPFCSFVHTESYFWDLSVAWEM